MMLAPRFSGASNQWPDTLRVARHRRELHAINQRSANHAANRSAVPPVARASTFGGVPGRRSRNAVTPYVDLWVIINEDQPFQKDPASKDPARPPLAGLFLRDDPVSAKHPSQA
jgi:hypothetical protein